MVEEQFRFSVTDKPSDLLAQLAVRDADTFDHGHEGLPSIGAVLGRVVRALRHFAGARGQSGQASEASQSAARSSVMPSAVATPAP